MKYLLPWFHKESSQLQIDQFALEKLIRKNDLRIIFKTNAISLSYKYETFIFL